MPVQSSAKFNFTSILDACPSFPIADFEPSVHLQLLNVVPPLGTTARRVGGSGMVEDLVAGAALALTYCRVDLVLYSNWYTWSL